MEPDRGPFKRKVVQDPPVRFHVNWYGGQVKSLGTNADVTNA